MQNFEQLKKDIEQDIDLSEYAIAQYCQIHYGISPDELDDLSYNEILEKFALIEINNSFK